MNINEKIKLSEEILRLYCLERIQNINGISLRSELLREYLAKASDKDEILGELARLSKLSDEYELELRISRNMYPLDYVCQTKTDLNQDLEERKIGARKATAYKRISEIEYLYYKKSKEIVDLVDEASRLAISLGFKDVYDLPVLVELGQMSNDTFRQVEDSLLKNAIANRNTDRKKIFSRLFKEKISPSKKLLDSLIYQVSQSKQTAAEKE